MIMMGLLRRFPLLFDNADPVLPPTGSTPPVVIVEEEPPRPGRVTCEGCGCSLDTKGMIIRRGDGLKRFIESDQTIARLQKELDTARARETELSAQLAALEKPKKRNLFI